MGWWQVSISCRKDDAPALSEAFETADALAVTLQDAGDDPLFEPWPGKTPLWDETRVTGLYDATRWPEPQALRATIREGLQNIARREADDPWRLETAWLDEEDWVRAGQRGFGPAIYGERLCVCPTWSDPPLGFVEPDADTSKGRGTLMWLDPGLAFGTGTHPTTALCLHHLTILDAQHRFSEIIDYGCGSGILAIAGLALGIDRCWAVDIDDQALGATLSNAQTNRVDQRLWVGKPEQLDGAVQSRMRAPQSAIGPAQRVVVANILAGPLIELADTLTDLLNGHGHLLLAGLTDTQVAEIQAAYHPKLELKARAQQDEWVLLHGQLNGST